MGDRCFCYDDGGGGGGGARRAERREGKTLALLQFSYIGYHCRPAWGRVVNDLVVSWA
jgi:hypothetical protein